MINKKTVTAILLIAGNSTRYGKNKNKNFELLKNKAIFLYSLEVFNLNKYIDNIIIVLKENEFETVTELLKSVNVKKKITFTLGGKSRKDSVFNALQNTNSDIVLIHDGARPLIKDIYIEKLLLEMELYKGATIAVKSKDTIKISDENNIVVETPNRNNTWIIQTPQCFHKEILFYAHQKGNKYINITDDCMLLENLGHTVKLVSGDYDNIKITTIEDIPIIEKFLKLA